MKHVFGPVHSRRLGRSLGIDPVPLKTCNFSCVYCQLGRTRPLTSKRKAFFGVSDILAEVATALGRQGPDAIDWITFVGSGETTLFSRLGSLIRFVSCMSRRPVAVITNGSLLYLPEVRKELSAADAVLPSLDAGSDELHRRIHRPHRDFSFARHVEGLVEFRKEYEGRLWIEVMLIRGVNDSLEALSEIANVLRIVNPDEVHISTPTRPPAEAWVEPPSPESLERARSIFGSVAKVLTPVAVDVELGLDDGLLETLTGVISRHPLDEIELLRTLSHWAPGRVTETLEALVSTGRIAAITRHGKRFWCAARTEFPDDETADDPLSARNEPLNTSGIPA